MRTFTEEEHEAILTEAVRRETAAAEAKVADDLTAKDNKIDLLEAEKAEAETKATTAETELAEYQATVETEREVASRTDDRVAAVRAISPATLPDAYFSGERTQRWAEMSDDSFGAFLDDMVERAMVDLDQDEAAEVASLQGEARHAKLGEIFAAKRGDQEQAGAHQGQPLRETASFSGGAAPKTPGAKGEVTNLAKWLGGRSSMHA